MTYTLCIGKNEDRKIAYTYCLSHFYIVLSDGLFAYTYCLGIQSDIKMTHTVCVSYFSIFIFTYTLCISHLSDEFYIRT